MPSAADFLVASTSTDTVRPDLAPPDISFGFSSYDNAAGALKSANSSLV